MTGNDIADPAPLPRFRPAPRDLAIAMALLSRLPLPAAAFPPISARPAAHAAWAYPLVGLVIGALIALAGWAAMLLGLPASAAALLAMMAGILATGAMHEDGLADCADGFWGGWTRERRLEIMKDSQIGTYGVIALVLSLGLRWLAIAALLASGSYLMALLCAAMLSRAAMVGVMFALPPARANGLSRSTGRPPQIAVVMAWGIGIAFALFVIPVALIPAFAITLLMAWIATLKIGGQTGDVLGATQQLVEITVLLTCFATLQ